MQALNINENNMDFFVYILQCRDDSYYVGSTDDLQKRLYEHETKKFSGYTSRRLPVKLVFHQTFLRRHEAQLAERMIKKWSRAKKEALISGGFEAVRELRISKKKCDVARPIRLRDVAHRSAQGNRPGGVTA